MMEGGRDMKKRCSRMEWLSSPWRVMKWYDMRLMCVERGMVDAKLLVIEKGAPIEVPIDMTTAQLGVVLNTLLKQVGFLFLLVCPEINLVLK